MECPQVPVSGLVKKRGGEPAIHPAWNLRVRAVRSLRAICLKRGIDVGREIKVSPFLGPARICPGMSTDSRHCGRIIDLHARRIFPGVIVVSGGRIQEILEDCRVTEPGYLCPGFIDAHVHIESSMLAPAEFGRIAVIHGTTGTVSDPHEIANVLGIDGVRYMQREAARTPLKIHFGIPSCVPATEFETAGAVLGPADIEELCRDASLIGLVVATCFAVFPLQLLQASRQLFLLASPRRPQ